MALPHLQYSMWFLFPHLRQAVLEPKMFKERQQMTTATEQLPQEEKFPYVSFGLKWVILGQV